MSRLFFIETEVGDSNFISSSSFSSFGNFTFFFVVSKWFLRGGVFVSFIVDVFAPRAPVNVALREYGDY